MHLEVDGKTITDWHRYALRWLVGEGGKPVPVLYCDGKRVTAAWGIMLSAVREADATGASTNTA